MRDKPTRAWAMFGPKGWIFTDSIRRTRRDVVEYANNTVPTWTWERYRKRGCYIAKVEIRQMGPSNA